MDNGLIFRARVGASMASPVANRPNLQVPSGTEQGSAGFLPGSSQAMG